MEKLCLQICTLLLALFTLPSSSYHDTPKTRKCYECGGPFNSSCSEGEGAVIEANKTMCEGGRYDNLVIYFDQKYGYKPPTTRTGKEEQEQRQITHPYDENEQVVCVVYFVKGERIKTCATSLSLDVKSRGYLCRNDTDYPSSSYCICVGDLCNEGNFWEKLGTGPTPSKASRPETVDKLVLAVTGLCLWMVLKWWNASW